MKNEEQETIVLRRNCKKVLPRKKEIKNTAENRKVVGGEHPTATWVKTYDMQCLK
ncbi:MAG: hypothetical protein K2X77_29595 [Candidatus Obscuribacterales bacterium]|jgi:hypothetical protein|nr:hypothetical protein [Candidatus Obscuribacterales bacterium]